MQTTPAQHRTVKGANRQTRLLVVDDSKMFRNALKRMVENEPAIQVVGEGKNGREALEMAGDLEPDVIVLDINMPIMDGLTALKHIMIRNPRPTVMFSTLTKAGAKVTFDALKFGAVDFIHKPSNMNGLDLDTQSRDMVRKVLLARSIRVGTLQYIKTRSIKDKPADNDTRPFERLVVATAGEGGYGALLKIIPKLTADLAVTFVAVLYESASNVEAFARYLDAHSCFRVKRAQNGDPLRRGFCYLVPGSEYATIQSRGNVLSLRVEPSPFPKRRGAGNMLMISAADTYKRQTLGLVLSGMGQDGSEGIREILRLGGAAIVQLPETCLADEQVQHALSENREANFYLLPDRDIPETISAM